MSIVSSEEIVVESFFKKSSTMCPYKDGLTCPKVNSLQITAHFIRSIADVRGATYAQLALSVVPPAQYSLIT